MPGPRDLCLPGDKSQRRPAAALMAVSDYMFLCGVPSGKPRTSGPSLGFSSVGYRMDLWVTQTHIHLCVEKPRFVLTGLGLCPTLGLPASWRRSQAGGQVVRISGSSSFPVTAFDHEDVHCKANFHEL